MSHRLGKTFESIFNSVICLPGCFCMYQVYSYNDEGFKIPILIDDAIMNNYMVSEVDTLHQKNLLLGEDRYLTALILRAFPNLKTIYCPGAVCYTIVPNSFSVLASQRRRWLNGEIHNLLELVVASELPGKFCFSLQFAFCLELFGGVTAPFVLLFTLYLFFGLFFGQSNILQIIFSIVSYFLSHFLIALVSLNPINVLWFLVYLPAVPIWAFILPNFFFFRFYVGKNTINRRC